MANDRPQDEQQQQQAEQDVNIVRLLHDEFGTASSTIRMQIASGRILIDGEEWIGKDQFVLPREAVAGKEIFVDGPDRKFKMKISG